MKGKTLKEYLISLGFSVDDQTYNAATSKMKTFEKVAGKMAGNVGKNMAKGSAVAVAALVAVTAGVNDFIGKVADADMATEKFARRMWMTETNARSLQNVLGAMGESMDSIYDVAANAELRGSFFALRADAAKLEGGPELDEAMVKIRNVQFEVQRLKLLLSYASRYIAYYLTQYLAVPMEQFRQALKAINDNGENIIKVWGDKVAKVLSWIVRLFAAGAKAGMSLIQMIQRLPYEVKAAMLAIAALGAIMLNPFTTVILAIGAILLLLDDFYTWQRGGESMFGDTWQQLVDFQEKLANTTFESQMFDDLSWLIDNIIEKFHTLSREWDKLNIDLGKLNGISIIQALLVGIDAATWSIRENFKSLVDFVGFLIGKVSDFFTHGLDFSKWDWSKPKELLTEIKKEVQLIFNPEDTESDGQKYSKPSVANLAEGKAMSESGNQDRTGFRPPKFNLPAMANPAMASILNTNKHYNDIKQDNSMSTEVHVTVTGSDADSAAIATAKEIETIMRRNLTSWQNARIKTASTS